MISSEPISPSYDTLQAAPPADKISAHKIPARKIPARKIKVKTELPPDAAQLLGDRVLLQLLTLNWVMNCIDATTHQSWN
jgi:phosphoglycerate-specific signal transduction histidine kinase